MTNNRQYKRPVVTPTFHHTTFTTMHLDEMVEFYEKVAGLTPVYYGEEAAWLSNDDANHRIALLAFPDLKAPEDKGHTAGLHHTAFEYPDFDSWILNYKRLKRFDIEPFVCLDHGMTMSMYYQDPEGNGVEIQVDAFGDWTKSTTWMYYSAEFGENPIGHHFDPQKVLEAYEAGATKDEIHARARNNEFEPAVIPDIHLPEAW